MFKAIIIGCGQLGSRHLQSLCKVDFPIHVTVVDPFESSLVTAQERANQVLTPESKVDLYFETDLEKISGTFDLAVIATNSDTRFSVFKKLVSQAQVAHIVFEKFLYQNRSDYNETLQFLKGKNIQGWVNTARRMFPDYQKWVELWRTLGPFEYKLDGGNWGLACNMVHHIDFYQHITGENIRKINMEKVGPEPVPAKRKGFYEFFGELNLEMSNGGHISLTARDTTEPPVVTLKFKNNIFVLNESKGTIVSDGNEESVRIPFQSELTQIVAQTIKSGGKIQLPTYEESMDYHVKLFDSFISHANASGHFKDGVLRIT